MSEWDIIVSMPGLWLKIAREDEKTVAMKINSEYGNQTIDAFDFIIGYLTKAKKEYQQQLTTKEDEDKDKDKEEEE